jgi:hypothetical protein
MSVDEVVSFPVKGKNGWFSLSDGRRVRGEKAAWEAEFPLLGADPVSEPVSRPEAAVGMKFCRMTNCFVEVACSDSRGLCQGCVQVPSSVVASDAAVTSTGTVWVDCRVHKAAGRGLASPDDLTVVVDHSFCPAVV